MVKQIITDEELKLKQQARRRLMGAIALTILVVTLLPMVLDREPPAPTQEIDMKIPDKDKVGEFVPKMVLPPTGAGQNVPAASAPVIAPLLDAKPIVAPEPVKAEPKPSAVLKPMEHAQPKPEIITPKPLKKEVKVKQESHAASKVHAGFIIQVGAFANADGAKKLQEKLHQQGYPSYTEKAGDKVRVRIGDYPTHAEAEKFRRKLEIQGYQPDVINLN